MTDKDEQRLERACEVFKEFLPDMFDGDQVQNLCDAYTERFRDMLMAFAMIWDIDEGREWKIEWFDLDENRPLPEVYPLADPFDDGSREGHCVFRLGEVIYDWTARQYREDAPVPLVWDAEFLRR